MIDDEKNEILKKIFIEARNFVEGIKQRIQKKHYNIE